MWRQNRWMLTGLWAMDPLLRRAAEAVSVDADVHDACRDNAVGGRG
jgi:hypothetical protein